jgi:hypothetical protein
MFTIKIQKYKNTKIQKYKNTKIQKYNVNKKLNSLKYNIKYTTII